MRPIFALAFFVGSVAVACGGAPDSTLLADGGGGGGGDASGGDVVVGPDGGTKCDVSRCANVPAGFHAVSLVDASSACPSGFDTSDLVTAPVANDGTCTCACNVTTQPDCSTGSITRSLDQSTSPVCGTQASTFPANGGSCSAINGTLYLGYAHYATNAPPPTGGACQYDATVDPQKVSSSKARVCAPPTGCPGAVCDTAAVCVAQDGDVPCPSDFPNKTLVGASASATCGACGGGTCSVTGACTGTLSFFTDMSCTQGQVDFTADGACTANPTTGGVAYTHYQYKGSVKSATCSGTAPTSTATATLDGPSTVCCKN